MSHQNAYIAFVKIVFYKKLVNRIIIIIIMMVKIMVHVLAVTMGPCPHFYLIHILIIL